MDNTTSTPLDAELVPNGANTPAMATQITPPSSVTNGHTSPLGAAYGDGATPTDLNASVEGKSDGKGSWTPGFRAQTAPERALKWERYFTQPGQDAFDTIDWEMRTAGITGEDGKSVFEQTNCEIPKPWSQLATNVVVSKYFRGPINSPQRETSVKQVIGRVADTIGIWGAQGGYFASDEDAENFRDELAYLLVHQYGAFNSPVWFNLGVKDARQQASACFINDVYDDMESIMELAATEARLFKGGSGAGVNLWRIRSSKEQLRGGGIASGPISFMRGWDAFAGAVKCLTPDAQVYTDQGLRAIGELIDPNLEPGFHADDSVVLATKDGPMRISQVYVSPPAPTREMELGHTGLRLRGTHQHPVLVLTPQFELQWKALSQINIGDRVAVARGQEMWPELAPTFDFAPQTTWAKKTLTYPTQMTPELARLLGYMTSEGCMDAQRFRFCNADKDVFADFLRCVEAVFGHDASGNVSKRINEKTGVTTQLFEACWTNAVRFLQSAGLGFEKSGEKRVPRSILSSPRALVVEFLRAYFEGDGHVSTYVYASSASRALLGDVQLLLLNMGMLPLLRRHPVGGKDYWNLCLRGEAAFRFVREIGFISARKQAASDVAGDKNTNIDTLPFLVDVLRQYASKNKYFHCADGQTRELGFGFFNRKAGSAISYNRLRNTPALLDQLKQVNPQLSETLEWLMEREFFWDTVKSVEAATPCVTYDFTVPQTHSFVANGIVNHNSGGTTRRAAKMVILNADHPDIGEFITCKADEEKKAWALIEAGYNGGFNVPGGAYDSVAFQNANHSVRVTDEFMRAAENDTNWQLRAVTTGAVVETKRARQMLQDIAQTTWICGDPGMQFDTIINDWHTCANTDRIYASNPCCITGDTLVGVADGRNAVAIRDLVGTEVPVYAHDHATGRTTISRMWNIEVKRQNVPVFRVTLDDGSSFRATDDHLIMLRDGSYRMVKDLKADDSLMPFHSKVLAPAKNRTRRRYIWNGATWAPQYRAIWSYFNGEQPAEHHIHHADFNALNDAIENLRLMPADEHNALHVGKMLGDNNPARRLMSDDWRAAISRAMAGENNPNYGKTHGDETRVQMSARAATRWSDPAQHQAASERASAWMAQAKAEGRPVGRRPKTRVERCCPICRDNFETPRKAQIFCSDACRLSSQGRAMTDAKRVAAISGRPLSADHRAKLSSAVSVASDSSQKREAAYAAQRNCALRAARLLLDQNIEPAFDAWAQQRQIAGELGATRVPTAGQLPRLFESEAAFRQSAALWNHKVVSVEFCGHEDVYDGTVDTHHNFAILTSAEQSCEISQQNFSGIFIHNSEFMFLDSTACNLASLNLLKFYNMETGEFDAAAYARACEVFITAQEIIVSFASYPTQKIGEMSEQYRPLGLGYANLGALLMAKGLAYDSDEGRALAGALTAIMTGAAYRKSAQIARNTGPFEGYVQNKEPMLRVIAKHRDAVNGIDTSLVAENVMQEARNVWDDAYMTGQKYGYRNSQATVLAPTGTISFMMDCDTTGVEPDIALVKYKKLVGGGLLKIVNQTVPAALRNLGYDESEIKTIVDYIDKNDTIEGAPGLHDDHLPVFDCAFKAMNGTRSIHHMGHIKMMAATQPFISGAISKTVNMPQDCTANEIYDAYLQSWKMGVKAVAIYRDGSKRTQPLSTASDAQKAEKAEKVGKEAEIRRAARRKLPDERNSITHKFSIAGQEGYFMVGLYEDGSPGEIFIKMSKEGSTISGLMDSFAVAVSMCLQYGVPLRVLVNKFSHTRFEPSGYTTNRDIPIAKSLMDYIFRWFDLKFHPNGDNGHVGKVAATTSPAALPEASLFGAENSGNHGNVGNAQREISQMQQDAPPCPDCGALTVRSGACYKCNECGATTGCG